MSGLQVPADLYNALFIISVANPDLEVNADIWNRIREKVPVNYTVPDGAIVAMIMDKIG